MESPGYYRTSHFDEGLEMKAIVLCVLSLAAMLPACSPTSSDTSDQATPNNGIYIMAAAEVSSPSSTGKATYTVYCQLQYTDTSKNSSEFNTAKVTANGVALTREYADGYFQNVGKIMSFSEGDSIEFVVKHPKVGTVRGTVYVPPSVTDLSVSPGLSQANLPNSEITFNLSWTPVAASYYMVQAVGYNYWQTEVVSQSVFPTQSDTATVVLQDTSGDACPWVYFRVLTIGTVSLQGFAAGSGLNVTGAYYKANTNMPGVSSNMQTLPHLGK